MKKLILAFALIASVSGAGLTAQAAPADNSAFPVMAIHVLKENAEALSQNAAIYQWMRVNRETDRIVAAAKKVEKALDADAAQKESAAALRDVVKEIRSARLNHDSDRLVEAAQKLSALADKLAAN